MSERLKNIILNLIAFLFILWGIIAVFNTIYYGGHEYVFYFCYAGLIIIGIGAFTRRSHLIVSQLNILAIPLLFWTFDFYYALITGSTIFGVVDYFFVPGPWLGKVISSQHLFNVPLSLLAVYLVKIDKNDAWKISSIQMVVIYFVSILLTSEINNINCVYNSCVNFIGNSFYPIKWFGFVFIMILITNFIITRSKIFKKTV